MLALDNFLKLMMIFISTSIVYWYSTIDTSQFEIKFYFKPFNTIQFVKSFSIMCAFYLVSFLEYVHMKGLIVKGPINPSGKRYLYKINVYDALFGKTLFIILFLLIDYSSMLIVSILFGIMFSFIFYLKGIIENEQDYENKPSYNFINDFYSGIQLVPRISIFEDIDLKLLIVGHIGMCLWFLLNIRNTIFGFGNGTFIPLIITLLQSLYIIFWALNEEWYLYTIDMNYDRLGFYLCFGSLAWIPAIYCNYTYYSSNIIITHNYTALFLYILLYLIGLHIFIDSNMERYMFRRNMKSNSKHLVVKFTDTNGNELENTLIIDGWWKYSRHINYLGDIIMVVALSLICGFKHIIPHFYTIMLIILLIHRIYRDEIKCSKKYGKGWYEYKKIVPYVLIPYIY